MTPRGGPGALGTRSEFAADAAVHIVGLVIATAAAAALIAVAIWRAGAGAIASAAAYSAALLVMLSLSALYNICRQSRFGGLFRRFDHSGIFLMIAGTYTPFTVLALHGAWSVGMTIAVWVIAAIGVTLKLALPPERFSVLTVILYLAFGWLGLLLIAPLLATVGPMILVLLAAGGAVYSLGVIFHAWESLPYQRAIWHGFVLAAAGIHYAAVVGVVLGR